MHSHHDDTTEVAWYACDWCSGQRCLIAHRPPLLIKEICPRCLGVGEVAAETIREPMPVESYFWSGRDSF